MYNFLKEVNHKCENPDGLNGMPTFSYKEVTSQFWNLIYKSAGQDPVKANSLDISNMEKQFYQSFEFKLKDEH